MKNMTMKIKKPICENCKHSFSPKTYWQKYCSKKCQTEAWWTRKIHSNENGKGVNEPNHSAEPKAGREGAQGRINKEKEISS
jgi:hypothetical protein